MKKIPTVFARDPVTHRVIDEITPGCEWLAKGSGVPTRKFDGTCCRVFGRKLWKRFELRPGKSAPDGFIPADAPDANTGKQPGWVSVGDGPEDKHHREAFALGEDSDGARFSDGWTYELCGPKVQKNPEGFAKHVLVCHGGDELPYAPRDFDALGAFLDGGGIEGIVWHDLNGPIGKLKAKDFGNKR